MATWLEELRAAVAADLPVANAADHEIPLVLKGERIGTVWVVPMQVEQHQHVLHISEFTFDGVHRFGAMVNCCVLESPGPAAVKMMQLNAATPGYMKLGKAGKTYGVSFALEHSDLVPIPTLLAKLRQLVKIAPATNRMFTQLGLKPMPATSKILVVSDVASVPEKIRPHVNHKHLQH